ncbi:Flavodoxin [Fibrobacter sp. UWT3]|uniref:flavodoxin n=1 Tax=Fibrobacter sp. UWT3 TaxID=1896225 RepID=UPI000BCC6048|nr:flavodoxin [Fibrobacter sp. UWT3]SOE79251.1 Flavodoxin [Fibrobacter sp. UWT3]
MRKKFGLILVAVAMCAFTACNQESAQSKTGEKGAQPEAAAPQASSKSLVVYYSQTGATKKLAEIFQKAKSADMFEIATVTPYPSTYDSTIAAVGAQRESKQWPALVNAKADLAKYDTVYLGYPIMFGSFAPPVYTFLDSNDLSGKVVVPFCTYGSGGRKASAAELKTLEPNANVTLAYGISNKRITAENGAEVATKEVEGFFADLATGKTDEMLMGGFTDQRALTAEDSAVFAAATKDYAYLKLAPLSVATQVVAGMNYLFVCTTSGFNRPPTETMVKIFKPLPGRGEPELIVMEK